MKRKVNIVTLGCSKNTVDSEHVMGALRANGFQVVHNGRINEAPLVIINTCGFIRDAKEESIETILRFVRAKKEGLVRDVFVMGCLSERYKDDLKVELSEVDEMFGVHDMNAIISRVTGREMVELKGERVLSTPAHYAYFKISEGCSRQCSFCAIPRIRGAHISRSMDSLVDEANTLASGGVKELIMIAQDLTWYGLDLYKKRALPELLTKLSAISGFEWIRLHYTYPEGFPMELLGVMAASPNVCRYLDIPIQHTSSRILQSMNRGGDLDSIRRLLDTIREKVPGIALRTTLISGYPGETEEEFRSLLSFVEEQRFERLGVFSYSHEEDTPAFRLEDDIPEWVKLERMEEIMLTQQAISLERNQDMIGKEILFLGDRIEEGILIGRTEFDSPEVDNEVLVRSYGDARPGDFLQVKVLEATEFDLHAVPV